MLKGECYTIEECKLILRYLKNRVRFFQLKLVNRREAWIEDNIHDKMEEYSKDQIKYIQSLQRDIRLNLSDLLEEKYDKQKKEDK